ncbi:MAG: AtpZ/AtpI family protein [Actinobacteria bacterium]|nr:AtpZ/AtpI family protein [Actinomycetota bacterium]
MTTPDPGRYDHMEGSRLVPPKDAITGGFSDGADLISYIISGLLIGLFLDWVFGIAPIMTILWLLAGFGVGFYRMWRHSEHLDQEGRERSHGV